MSIFELSARLTSGQIARTIIIVAMMCSMLAALSSSAHASSNTLSVVCADNGGNDYIFIDKDEKFVRMQTDDAVFEYRDGQYGIVLKQGDVGGPPLRRKQIVEISEDYIKFGVVVDNKPSVFVIDLRTGLMTPPHYGRLECRQGNSLK
jgi:hypothetical protein